MYVITAQKGGAIRESMAVGKAYAEAKEKSTGSPLVDQVLESLSSVSPNEFDSKDQFRSEAISHIEEAIKLLAATATEADVSAYRDFILELVQGVADADKSGGFLGIGGERETTNETLAIDEIRGALG
jgi:uncharacterized protein YaaR (DUF327 family)